MENERALANVLPDSTLLHWSKLLKRRGYQIEVILMPSKADAPSPNAKKSDMPSRPNSSHHQLEEVSFLPSDALHRWFKQIHKHYTISRIIGIFSSDLFSGAHHHRFIHHTNTTTSPMATNPTGKKAQGGFVLFCTLFQLKRRLHVRRQ